MAVQRSSGALPSTLFKVQRDVRSSWFGDGIMGERRVRQGSRLNRFGHSFLVFDLYLGFVFWNLGFTLSVVSFGKSRNQFASIRSHACIMQSCPG
jgi:hypothetical protein